MDLQTERCGELIAGERGSARCQYPRDHDGPLTIDGELEHYCCTFHVDGECKPGKWTTVRDALMDSADVVLDVLLPTTERNQP